MDLTRTELVDIGLDALTADPVELPLGMGDRVRDAAVARRRPTMHAGWLTVDGELSAHGAFVTTAAELWQLLDTLSPEEWEQATEVAGGVTVRELVVHLVGVERYMLGQLGRRPGIDAPRRDDHFPVSSDVAADLAGADGRQLVQAWWAEALELLGACAEVGPDHEVAYHHLAGSVRGMLVTRTFELWTHDDDIRRAVGLPANDLDAPRLSLMSTALLNVLPFGLALAGTTRPGRTVRIELTGAGGGTGFDAPLAPGELPGAPDLTIGASALDLCRLAANRLGIDRIDLRVEGDRSLLEPVLVGATAFALD